MIIIIINFVKNNNKAMLYVSQWQMILFATITEWSYPTQGHFLRQRRGNCNFSIDGYKIMN